MSTGPGPTQVDVIQLIMQLALGESFMLPIKAGWEIEEASCYLTAEETSPNLI